MFFRRSVRFEYSEVHVQLYRLHDPRTGSWMPIRRKIFWTNWPFVFFGVNGQKMRITPGYRLMRSVKDSYVL